MIQQFTILSRTGLVLWALNGVKDGSSDLPGEPVNALLQNVLLEEKTDATVGAQDGEEKTRSVNIQDYRVHWKTANRFDLIFVCVSSSMFHLSYAGTLITTFMNFFMTQFAVSSEGGLEDTITHWGRRGGQSRLKQNYALLAKAFEDILTDVEQNHFRGSRSGRDKAAEKEEEKTGSDVSFGTAADSTSETRAPAERGRRKGPRPFKHKNKKGASSESSSKKKKKKGKKKTEWDDLTKDMSKVTKKDMDKFDRSGEGNSGRSDATFGSARGEKTDLERSVGLKATSPRSSWSFAGFSSFVKDKTSSLLNKEIERSDLEAPLAAMKQQLVSRNVAVDIAGKLCESVASSLIGKRCSTFTRIQGMVQEALSESIERILTPKRSIDVLRSVQAAREKGKVFSIVFVGINGVGKSTSLSKVAYYLSNQNLKVKIAACDTFRSGAVEQLETHGHRLGIEVFSMGYAKNPSAVAGAALKDAKKTGADVVLIDTAGRMQNNKPLMQALAKLVNDNKPDLVLFVGEALVGNDGIDQLQLFNRAFVDYGSSRAIDGIVLTKFDTIDNKVGAALSMVYLTGQPVVFVGTGQKYTHLNTLNVADVVRALFES